MGNKICSVKDVLYVGIVLLLSNFVHAQRKGATITGTVTDESGKPLYGVSVTIKNSKIGVETDSLGKYTLKNVVPKSVLHFSMVGFMAQEVLVVPGTTNYYNVRLASVAADMEEILVVGYGSIKKKDLTGSVGTVNVEALQKAPVRSFDEALAGRVAGVQVASQDGQPGSAINIIVRGASSITQETAPLYVIDGFPVAASEFNTNQLDPNEIESITVLKDAAATAMYGAQGSNGVIVITTKKGKAGKAQINFNPWYGFQHNIQKMQMLNAEQWAQLQADNQTANPPADYENAVISNKSYRWYVDSTRPLDMQDLLFRTGLMQNYSLNISGGNVQTKYSVSGNYLNQLGTIINSGYKRYRGRIDLDQQINSKFKIGADITYTNTLQSGISPSVADAGSSQGSLMWSILGYRPFTGMSDSAYQATLEDPSEEGVTGATDYTFNPLINQQHLVRTTENNILLANGYLQYTITPKLQFRSTFVYNRSFTQKIIFNDSLTLYGSDRTPLGNSGPNGSVSNATSSVWSNENYLTYNNRFNKRHNLNVLAGVSEKSYKMSLYSVSNKALSNPELGIAGIEGV
ncbi:MAG: SusC/RagA family TonB-linked outer membrane protein [Niabella sp.]